MLVSLKEESVKRLRGLAHDRKGGKKGALSEVVEEALELLEKRARQEKAIEKLRKMVHEAKPLGIGKFNREDAYAR